MTFIQNLGNTIRDKSKYRPMPKRIFEKEIEHSDAAIQRMFAGRVDDKDLKKLIERGREKVRREAKEGHVWARN